MSFDISISLIHKLFDILSLRQETVVNNIANASDEQFKTSAVDSQALLKPVADALNDNANAINLDALIAKVEPKAQYTQVRESLTDSMSALSQNQNEYQTLVKFANMQYDLMRTAINGGKS